MVNWVSVNRFDKTWSQRTHDGGVEKRVSPRRIFVVAVVLAIGTFWMRGTRERADTARQSYYGCWSIEASIEVAGNRLRVERGRTQLTVGVASALCVTIYVINYRWSAGFHWNWWIWMHFGTGGWSSMFCVEHRFSSMISFTDDVALFIDVFTWFYRWFFSFGTRWVLVRMAAHGCRIWFDHLHHHLARIHLWNHPFSHPWFVPIKVRIDACFCRAFLQPTESMQMTMRLIVITNTYSKTIESVEIAIFSRESFEIQIFYVWKPQMRSI